MDRSVFRFGGVLALCALLFGATLLGAAKSAGPEDHTARKVEPKGNPVGGAAVVFNNRTVFEMQGAMLGYSPAQRDERAEQRLAEVLGKGGAGEVTTRMTSEGAAIFVDGALVFLVTPGDVNVLGGETLDSTVGTVVRNLSKAIDEAREGRDLRRMLPALAKSVFVGGLFGLRRGLHPGRDRHHRLCDVLAAGARDAAGGRAAHPGAAGEPCTLRDSDYVEYRLAAYAGSSAPAKRVRAMSDLHAAVQDVFNEYGVQIMSPHYVTDPRSPQVVPKANWFAAPAPQPAGDGVPTASVANRVGDRP